MFFGPPSEHLQGVLAKHPAADLAWSERLPALILLVALLVVGFWPRTVSAPVNAALAAPALVGTALGAGDVARTRDVLRRCLRWGVDGGAVLGVLVAAVGPLVAPLFTSDAAVQDAVVAGLIVAGVLMPLGGWVFVLDGVLIGAGDGRYLARAGMLTLVVYAPCALAVRAFAPGGSRRVFHARSVSRHPRCQKG